MTVKTDVIEDEVVTAEDPPEDQPEVVEEEGAETPEGVAKPEPVAAEEDDEMTVTIGDEPAPEPEAHAPEWVRDLRKSYRDLQKENRELKASRAAPADVAAPLPKKPALDELDYDTDKYEAALTSWYDQKRKHDERERTQATQAEEQQKAWAGKLQGYAEAKTALKVRDFDDAEAFIQEAFNVTQQGVVLQGADNPALVVYALGKNPAKAKELAAINDPVKFAFAIAKLETQLKTTSRKPVPAPERVVSSGSGKTPAGSASTLEKLYEQAQKSGDYSKYYEHKRNAKK